MSAPAAAASELAAILLAAGSSTRLGEPKQLVRWNGEPLIRRAARLALEAGACPVWVVLPPGAADMQRALDGLAPVRLLESPETVQGMGRSLAVAMKALLAAETVPQRVLLLVCDQPLIGAEHLRRLLDALGEDGITAALYQGRPGVPAVFDQRHFPALACAKGDEGARALLRHGRIATVALAEAAADIDTPNDLRFLR